jgi:hypothetical protein
MDKCFELLIKLVNLATGFILITARGWHEFAGHIILVGIVGCGDGVGFVAGQ